jgi:hypothetical protein
LLPCYSKWLKALISATHNARYTHGTAVRKGWVQAAKPIIGRTDEYVRLLHECAVDCSGLQARIAGAKLIDNVPEAS